MSQTVMSHQVTGPGQDICSLIQGSYGNFRNLFKQYKDSEQSGRDKNDLQQKVFDIIKALSQHLATEEMVLYPIVRDRMSANLADLYLAHHNDLKLELYLIDQMKLDDQNFTQKVDLLINDMEKYMKEEERDVLASLSKAVPSETLHEMGNEFISRMKIAPTRPHPSGPTSSGTLSTLANLAMKPIDALRDRVREHDIERTRLSAAQAANTVSSGPVGPQPDMQFDSTDKTTSSRVNVPGSMGSNTSTNMNTSGMSNKPGMSNLPGATCGSYPGMPRPQFGSSSSSMSSMSASTSNPSGCKEGTYNPDSGLAGIRPNSGQQSCGGDMKNTGTCNTDQQSGTHEGTGVPDRGLSGVSTGTSNNTGAGPLPTMNTNVNTNTFTGNQGQLVPGFAPDKQ